jgi:L-iditol 2-dehydrogenase
MKEQCMNNYPKTMKALVAYSKTDYRLETAYPSPECEDDDIIVKVEGCGICAGDLKCKHGAAMFWGDGLQPAYVKTPVIPGHEFVGHIVEMGKNVKGYALGDRVTAEQILPCGECRYCKSGKYWMCQPHDIFGFQFTNNGAMAEYMKFPKNSLVYKVPKDLPLEKALLIEPYGCSKHAVDRARIQCDDIVVISGAGTLGLGMVSYAALKHPRALISLDMVDERLAKAKEFGATHIFNPS